MSHHHPPHISSRLGKKISKWAVTGTLALTGILAFLILTQNQQLQLFLASHSSSEQVALGEVLSVGDRVETRYGAPEPQQILKVRVLSGPDTGQELELVNKGTTVTSPSQKVRTGETIILTKNSDLGGGPAYFMSDRYRLPAILLIFLVFVAAVVIIGQWRGLTSLLGLLFSVAIFGYYIVPSVLAGHDPLFVSLSGSFFITLVSLYLAHGLKKQTTIALIGTTLTLILSVGLAVGFVHISNFVGVTSEDAFYLRQQIENFDLRGLLLGGIIIGMLGILDDVAVGQAFTVYEIWEANPRLRFRELYRKGLAVGREHIASLVNTLFLAYAGVAMPMTLVIVMSSSRVPLWWMVNGEPIAEEIVRTLVGSLALIAAVPITTFFAAYYYGHLKGRSD